MTNALIGYSGFVGGTLLKQHQFESLFRSNNIQSVRGQSFDMVLCAGAPAQKWIANQKPEDDRENIDNLIEHLKSIRCNTFVLISTIDVFKTPIDVDETTPVDESGLHAYGLHRRRLEKFVQNQFAHHLILRLPGLVGPGLRKNIVYDFLNRNNLHLIDSRGIFQFYPMVNLWSDIGVALRARLKLVHLTAEPVSVASVSMDGFGESFEQFVVDTPPLYDVRSCHASIFGAVGDYQYSARETIQAIRCYAQSELLRNSIDLGARP